MPVIRMPNPLRPYVGGLAEVPVSGKTAGEAMQDLTIQFPELRQHLFKQDGSLRAFVNLFVEGRNIRDLAGLETPLETDTVFSLVPAIAGG